MRRLLGFTIFALLLSLTGAQTTSATTYYIAANGLDSNNGTSEATPWAHLPGMLTWTGSHNPVAGDTFILRGCDVWANASFPISWAWGGTSSSPITIDRDPTWYNTSNCPSGWNRAVFDAGGKAIQAPECTGGNRNFYLMVGAVNYVNFKWIEAKGYFWNSDQGSACYGDGGFFQASASDYITLDSWYFHYWSVGSSASDNDHMIFIVNTPPYCIHCLLTNSVFDNSDGPGLGRGTSGVGVNFNAINNIFRYVTNAIKPQYQGEYAGNNISAVSYGFDGDHGNCIETVAANGPSHTYYFHDNLIYDNFQCEGFQVGNPNEIDYAWNNIWYNNTSVGANGPDLPQAGSKTSSLYYWNNTNVDSGPVCIRVANYGNSWSTAFVMQNNHCITSGTPGGTTQSGGMINGTITGATTISISNNVVESLQSANGKGYTNAEPYVYSPTSLSSETVGAGVNVTSLWPSGFNSNDTSYSCVAQTLSNVVQAVCNQRAQNTRPTTGPWDAGAYEFGAGVAQPNPPTGLKATVQ